MEAFFKFNGKAYNNYMSLIFSTSVNMYRIVLLYTLLKYRGEGLIDSDPWMSFKFPMKAPPPGDNIHT